MKLWGHVRLCGLGHHPSLRAITQHDVLGDSKECSVSLSSCLIAGSAHLVPRSPALYANILAMMAGAAISVDAGKQYLQVSLALQIKIEVMAYLILS